MIVCGTGHRPDKLGGYGNIVHSRLVNVAKAWLKSNKPSKVISGGALGWDQALAAAARYLGIPYVMALPFPDFDSKWPEKSRNFLKALCDDAAEVVFVKDGPYAAWKMQERNKWMVDHSDKVLALWNGTSGGTANCVKYAESVGKPISNVWEAYTPPDSCVKYNPTDEADYEADQDWADYLFADKDWY